MGIWVFEDRSPHHLLKMPLEKTIFLLTSTGLMNLAFTVAGSGTWFWLPVGFNILVRIFTGSVSVAWNNCISISSMPGDFFLPGNFMEAFTLLTRIAGSSS